MQVPSSVSGFRDFLPAQAIQRKKLIASLSGVFESFGFAPLETPAMEALTTLTGKYGEEGEQLIFKVLKRGQDLQEALDDRNDKLDPILDKSNLADMGMRYDLTVPLARVIAQYQEQIKPPFRRYQIAPVWRAESAKKGRFREFYQCDADIVGTASMVADAEIVLVIFAVLKSIGFSNFQIRINNRKILDGILETLGITQDLQVEAMRALDKLEKVGAENVIEEMTTAGIDKVVATDFVKLVSTTETEPRKVLACVAKAMTSDIGIQGIDELTQVVDFIERTTAYKNTVIDLSVARGLDYYTGTVYETTLLDAPQFGSVMSGGRFDKLIGMFSGRDIPAVGASLGLDRIFAAMEELGMVDLSRKTPADCFIAMLGDVTDYALEVADKLRAVGKKVYVFPLVAKLGVQLGAANDLGVEQVFIIGEDEKKGRTVTIKDMATREQKTVSFDKLS